MGINEPKMEIIAPKIGMSKKMGKMRKEWG